MRALHGRGNQYRRGCGMPPSFVRLLRRTVRRGKPRGACEVTALARAASLYARERGIVIGRMLCREFTKGSVTAAEPDGTRSAAYSIARHVGRLTPNGGAASHGCRFAASVRAEQLRASRARLDELVAAVAAGPLPASRRTTSSPGLFPQVDVQQRFSRWARRSAQLIPPIPAGSNPGRRRRTPSSHA